MFGFTCYGFFPQCDHEVCIEYPATGATWENNELVLPTLATCDLVRSGLLERTDSVFTASRGWATFRLLMQHVTPYAQVHRSDRSRGQEAEVASTSVLPCVMPCHLRWSATASAATNNARLVWFAGHMEEDVSRAQRTVRPKGCQYVR